MLFLKHAKTMDNEKLIEKHMKLCDWCGSSLGKDSVIIADKNVCWDCYKRTIPYGCGVFIGNRKDNDYIQKK